MDILRILKRLKTITILLFKENKDLQERIGQYVENMNWDKLLIKMQIPCSSVKSNKTRDYYLEKLEGDGSYRTLQMPSPTGT